MAFLFILLDYFKLSATTFLEEIIIE